MVEVYTMERVRAGAGKGALSGGKIRRTEARTGTGTGARGKTIGRTAAGAGLGYVHAIKTPMMPAISI